ncbi:MAG: hypothetical protein JO083_04040 [Candidatus Eremiobacteraeota bacterium]|nr:hypothetical protein [Candidatus Eremiobacteraeota bacterium]
MVLLAPLVAAFLGASQLDAPHAALYGVLAQGTDAGGCDAAQLRKAAANAPIRPLGSAGGDRVVLAEVFEPCICGAQNCPYYVLRLGAGKPRVLVSGYAISVKTKPAPQLPTIVARMHDSAMVVDESTYTYRNGAYALTDSARVRGDTEARKPNDAPVHFAAGASSASLHGSVSTGWYDSYAFDAARGQTLLIDGVRSGAKLVLHLSVPDGDRFTDVRPGTPFTLPKTGTYHLIVDTDSVTDVAYALTLAIR